MLSPSPHTHQGLIKAFFRYFWGTPVDSIERKKAVLYIMQGGLDGHAIAVVKSEGACKGKSPAIPPAYGGSQMFVFDAAAVEEFRAKVLAPFFVSYADNEGKILRVRMIQKEGKKLDKEKFLQKLNDLQAQQLAATLKLLSPANALPIWSVTIETKQDETKRAKGANSRNIRG